MEISAFFNSRIAIQWGSTIRSCPDFDWSKNGWFANGLDLEWDLEAQPFENQPKWQQSCIYYYKSVQILNGRISDVWD